jgi:hypothetical protein
MSWQYKCLFFSLGLFFASGMEAARADEGFLCEGGRIVYVTFGELDKMKLTDACIAGYFGLKVAPATAAAAPAAALKTLESPAKIAPIALRALQDPDLAHKAGASRIRLVAIRREPPKAAEGTDFRNVQVLNAASQSQAVFVHAR